MWQVRVTGKRPTSRGRTGRSVFNTAVLGAGMVRIAKHGVLIKRKGMAEWRFS